MTLTEQLKKGELPFGCYYIKDINDETFADYYINNGFRNGFEDFFDDEIEEVLAPVPSYEEYNRLKEVERKKGKLVNVNYKIKQENQQLEELLKECRVYVENCEQFNAYDFEMLKTIDNAIGEK